jgi:hypothetical protein
MRFVLVAVALTTIACGSSVNDGGEPPGDGSLGDGTSSDASTDGNDTGTIAPPPTCERDAGSGPPPGFHVSTTGKPDGDGTAARPWDLATALKPAPAVKPGDTVWVHGGVYSGAFVSKLQGTDGAPVTLRSYPGEWATIDGKGATDPTLQIYKGFAVFRDLEITNSDPTRFTTKRPSGIYVEAKNIKLVNLAVHDTGTGVICNSATATAPELAPELEIYGSLLWANGWDDVDRGHGHHLYLQNRDGTKHVLDNILFDAFAFGVHAYSDTDEHFTQGYEIAGNVWWNNGAGSAGDSKLYDDCMVGHNGTHPVARVLLKENYGWARAADERDVRLGWSADNEDATVVDNYLVGTMVFQKAWKSVVMTGNTFYGAVTGVDTATYPANTYLTARPKGAKVIVRPNRYQAGRANVIVYNWDSLDKVDVDPSTVLEPGMRYEVRNAQDYFQKPVLSGTYTGGMLSLPMTGLTVAQPVGSPGAIVASEQTGKDFNVFVLLGACGP